MLLYPGISDELLMLGIGVLVLGKYFSIRFYAFSVIRDYAE
jgi:hypothetical protein